jgi:hypothetical protein
MAYNILVDILLDLVCLLRHSLQNRILTSSVFSEIGLFYLY